MRLPGARVSSSDFWAFKLLTSIQAIIMRRVAASERGSHMIEHAFTGPPFTVGIEEELMLLDPDTLDLAGEIEAILAAVPPEHEGQVKPELLTSVLEIATPPCADVNEAGAELAELRQMMVELAAERNLLVGAAGTHPFARWEEQAIVDRPRYRELVEDLGYIARRELIFGTHVHVAIEGADRAIYVADGIRRYLPLLLALSTNSPFWRGHTTGMMSARVPVFRAFPREGIPPHYGTWEIYSHRVGQMIRAGRDRGLHVPVVGRPAPPEARHRRDADLRPADEPRGNARAGGAHRLARPPARRRSTTPRSR